MKTIAVSIDEASLAAVDRLARASASRRGARKATSRSKLVRQALQEFLARQRRDEREEVDRRILRSQRGALARQAAALVSEQADV